MTLRGEVLSIETRGDAVRVRAQVEGVRDAAWRPMRVVEVDLAQHEAARLHVGDTIRVTVERVR